MKRLAMLVVLVAVAAGASGQGVLDPVTRFASDVPGNLIAAAGPISPTMLRLMAAAAEEGEDVTPLLRILAGPREVVAAVDVAATRQERGHFSRNWGKYTVGAIAAGGLGYAAKRDFWRNDDASPAAPAEPSQDNSNTGTQVSVNSGDNSPVTITITQMPPE